MTQAPEAQLIRELELCYVNISVITDYDTGVEGEIEPVSHAAVLETFNATLGHSARSPGPAHPGRRPNGTPVPVRNRDASGRIASPRSADPDPRLSPPVEGSDHSSSPLP